MSRAFYFLFASYWVFPTLVLPQALDDPQPPLIIFDTDMGSDCDDVGALAILHNYQIQGKVK
mgnify:CR=1 FL=1